MILLRTQLLALYSSCRVFFLFPQPQHCEYISLPPFVSFARGVSSHATLCNSYNCNYNCRGDLIICNQYQYQPVSVRQFLCNSCNSKSPAFCLFPLQYAWLFRIYRCFFPNCFWMQHNNFDIPGYSQSCHRDTNQEHLFLVLGHMSWCSGLFLGHFYHCSMDGSPWCLFQRALVPTRWVATLSPSLPGLPSSLIQNIFVPTILVQVFGSLPSLIWNLFVWTLVHVLCQEACWR